MAFIQSGGNFSNSASVASLAEAFASNLTAGSDLFAFVADYYKTTTAITVTVTDTKSNTWTQVASVFISGQITGRIFYAANSGSGACTVTATFNGTNGQYPGLAIFEAPVGSGMTVDGFNTANGNSTSATVSYTPTADGYAVGMAVSATGTCGDPSGWNVREGSGWSTSGRLNKACDKAALNGVGLTLTSTVTSGSWLAIIAVLKASGGGTTYNESGNLAGTGGLTVGAVTRTAALSGTLSGTGGLTGSIANAIGLSGSLGGTAGLSTAAILTAAMEGDLAATGGLTGSVLMTLAHVGAFVVSAAMTGAGVLAAALEGTLSAVGDIVHGNPEEEEGGGESTLRQWFSSPWRMLWRRRR